MTVEMASLPLLCFCVCMCVGFVCLQITPLITAVPAQCKGNKLFLLFLLVVFHHYLGTLKDTRLCK